jgi:uncharacterized protein (DUF362 family)
MSSLTRREFLKLSALAAASLALLETGCSPQPQATSAPFSRPQPQTTTAPTTRPQPLATTSPVAHTPIPTPTSDQAYLAVAHGADPAAIVTAALASLGGMGRFVKKGQDVIIKPNICADYHPPEYAATTNPVVVATLVTLCLAAGARQVRVMDSPFPGISPTSAYAISGIEKAVKAAGGKMEVMSPIKFAKTAIPQGKSITSWNVYRDILETDVLINVPIAKNHSLARLTLGGKNLLGVITEPNQIHGDLGQRVADLASLVRPDLTVVDAFRILMEHGPTGGSLDDVKQASTIIASHDIIAADSFAATLFGLTGADIPYIAKGAAMGLGTLDLSSIKVAEFNV